MMGKALKRLVTRVVLIAVVVLAAYGGWKWGSAVFPRMEEMLGIDAPAEAAGTITPEVAGAATDKIEAFRDSEDPELRLESSEVSSLLRYAMPGMLPGGVVEPRVSFDGDRVEIRAQVLPAKIPDLPGLGGILGILPDTVPVSIDGSLIPFGERGSMLLVRSIEIRGVPVPAPAFPDILSALGRNAAPGLPAAAILVPVLGGIQRAYIEDGKLVLVRA